MSEAPAIDVKAFGRALRDRLAALDKSQEWLAAQVAAAEGIDKLSQEMVSGWCRGSSPPKDPQRTFTIERIVGMKPGELSWFLGYLPVGAVPPTSAAAIRSDPNLTEPQRNLFLRLLEELAGPPTAEEVEQVEEAAPRRRRRRAG